MLKFLLMVLTVSTTFSTTSNVKCDQKPTADFVEGEILCSAHDRTSAEIHMKSLLIGSANRNVVDGFSSILHFQISVPGEGPWNPPTKGIHELNPQYTNSFFPTIFIRRGQRAGKR